ncbi:hypothetical protein FHG87_016740, partial [Trinorchestia longiramus]
GRWTPNQWELSQGKGPSTFLGSYRRARVEGRRGRTYWEWKAAEMLKAVSGEEGDDERTSQDSGPITAQQVTKEQSVALLRDNYTGQSRSTAPEKIPFEKRGQNEQGTDFGRGDGRRETPDSGARDAAEGAGSPPNEGGACQNPASEDRTTAQVGGVRVLPPFVLPKQYDGQSQRQPLIALENDRNEPLVHQHSVVQQSVSDSGATGTPIAKVKVTSYVQPKFYYPPSCVSPSAPTREVLYNEPLDDDEELRSQPIGEEAEPPYDLKEPPAWTRQASSSPSLSGILKRPSQQKTEHEKSHGSPKIKFKNGGGDARESFDLRVKPPIPGKSSSSSSSNASPNLAKLNQAKSSNPVFKTTRDSKPDIFSGVGIFKNQSSFGAPSQQSSFPPASKETVVRRPINKEAPRCRRGVERESGALVWVCQPGGGAKLDWVPTPNLSTLRSQPHTPGALVTRQGSDAGTNTRPPDRGGGGRHSVERMQSSRAAGSGSGGPATTCSPPILKHTQSSESKNVLRSAPGNARPEGRSKNGEAAEDCVVSVPGKASGQIVRIRVRPEVHAYLAGLPVTSSPSLGERRDSLRSLHSTHSSSASALTGCSESGGEGSAGYHEQDYSAVVDEYTLLQKAVVDHDPEALRLLSAAEAAMDPGHRVTIA